MGMEWIEKEGIEDGQLYHVYNRGNDRSLIFGDKSDYGAFITKLKLLAVKHMVDAIVFTLMPNHYHLIVLQKPSCSLSSVMAALATSAATRFNLKYGHIGHLFQGPFKYKPVSEEAYGMWHVTSISIRQGLGSLTGPMEGNSPILLNASLNGEDT